MSEDNTEPIQNEMLNITQNILEKHLNGRKVDLEKVRKWGDLIIDEIYKELSELYPQYGFCIFFLMSDKSPFVSNHRTLYYQNTDVIVLSYYYTSDFNSEIRLIATKLRRPMENFLEFAKNKELSLEISKKISDYLEDRKYKQELCQELLENIVSDINGILSSKENNPVSYQVAFIHKRPTKNMCFYYKFFKIKLHTLFFKYQNRSFICRDYLFLIDN